VGGCNVLTKLPGLWIVSTATDHEALSGRLLILSSFLIVLTSCSRVGPLKITFAQSAPTIEAYDFVEVTADVSLPRARNPFADVTLTGWFEAAGSNQRWQVEASATRKMEAYSVYGSCPPPPESTDTLSSIANLAAAGPEPVPFTPLTDTGAAPSGSIRSTVGILPGRALGNTISSMEPPPIG